MSILAAAPTVIPASNPALPTSVPVDAGAGAWVGYLILGLFTALAIALARRFGVFRRESVIGPKRLADRGDAGPLLFVMIVGLFLWLFSQVVYGAYKGMQLRNAGVAVNSTNAEHLFDDKDFALISTVPFIIGFIVLLLGNKFFRRDGLKTLGFSISQFGSGVRAGIVAFLVIVPAVIWTLQLTERVVKATHMKHPEDHPLIKALLEAQDPVVRWALIVGATLCAPFFEEFLFRGHLQTLLRYLFMRMSRLGQVQVMSPAGLPFPLSPPPPPASISGATSTEPPVGWMQGPMPDQPMGSLPSPFAPPWQPMFQEPPPLEPRAWHSWLAILITSLGFALLHPAWTAPAIFVLAVGLGYVYERTGNLWAPITVHLLFNSLETLMSQLTRGH